MNDSDRKTDLRVVKTLNSLSGALSELLCEKDPDSITVKEICDRAQTRKATFYNHFSDKNDLLAYIIRTQMEISEEQGAVYDDPDDPSVYYSDILLYLMDFLEKNEKMMQHIVKSGSRTVSSIYKEEMEPVFNKRLKAEQKKENGRIHLPEMLSAVISEMIIQIAQYWFMNKDTITKKEAALQLKVFIKPLFEK